jgi:hypothetical protein
MTEKLEFLRLWLLEACSSRESRWDSDAHAPQVVQNWRQP